MNHDINQVAKKRLVLLSLFSKEDNSSGLAVYDLESSTARYVHLLDFSNLPGRICHLRGVHWGGDRLYAVTPFALLIFRAGIDLNGPGLVLEKEVCLREWILGEGQQGNLHAVCVALGTNLLHVSFNSQSAIDTLDKDGNFVRREYLWDFAPELLSLPTHVPADKTFRFGVVRHIFEDPTHGLVFVASFLNNSRRGALIAAETGKILFDAPFNPHGGLVYQERLYLTDIDAGLVHAYPWSANQPTDNFASDVIFMPQVDKLRWPASVQNVRGMTVLDDRLVCGICNIGKAKSSQIPPRLVEFDLSTGKQVYEHFLPDFLGFQKAQVNAINPVPQWLTDTIWAWGEPRYFRHDQQFNPDFFERRGVLSPNTGINEIHSSTVIEQNNKHHVDFLEIVNVGCEQNTFSPPSIELANVDLCFVRRARSIFGMSSQLKKSRSFCALRNVTFTLHEGENVGVIGRNGSGKSTLSLVCAGVYKPDSGTVTIHGRVQLLALGVGFKKELTGRDNVFISASLLGLSRKRTREIFPEIEAFAELGEFMDEPVRTYSSGMKSKLGFAVATAVEPEILILDEAMSVGDKAFKDKAMVRMREMQKKAKSVLIVSHNPGEIKKLCSRVLWMERGRLLMDGDANTVVHAYENFCKNPEKWLLRNPEYILETV